ncbi:MAG: TetR/AcrR family transcriptional regulator [Mariniphaga sp.]|nr:TetR/AcrR family transcriptional regulator [Mariniphaga sp.]
MKKVKSKKYRDIIETARELFWKHGFRRVTIQEICEKSAVSKVTFYNYFPNKIELAKTVFLNVVQEGQEKFNDLIQENISTEEKIEKLILFKAETTNNISKEFLNDFYLGSEKELQQFVEQTTKKAWDSLLKDYRIAQENGIFRNDFNPEFFLKISFKLVEMLHDEELAQLYNTPQDLILEFARFVAYGISPRNK